MDTWEPVHTDTTKRKTAEKCPEKQFDDALITLYDCLAPLLKEGATRTLPIPEYERLFRTCGLVVELLKARDLLEYRDAPPKPEEGTRPETGVILQTTINPEHKDASVWRPIPELSPVQKTGNRRTG
jgi:hypothetical protein